MSQRSLEIYDTKGNYANYGNLKLIIKTSADITILYFMQENVMVKNSFGFVPLTIFVSGVHSGPNPSPGLGIARSLRSAYPDATIIAADYSTSSTGLSWPEFNSRRVFPAWEHLDKSSHLKFVDRTVVDGVYWVPASDREVRWLADKLNPNSGMLCPSKSAIEFIKKPCAQAAEVLGISSSPALVSNDPFELHRFGRKHGWEIWVKGPWTHAVPVRDWKELLKQSLSIASLPENSGEFLIQLHVEGRGESVAFCALKGKVLGMMGFIKRETTAFGKTWTGIPMKIPSHLQEGVERFVEKTFWTGGGEIEMIRDNDDNLWLLEINPRFPAWIHGATLTGQNLPANLLHAVSGRKPSQDFATSHAFTRVVAEIPVRDEIALQWAEEDEVRSKRDA